MNAFQTAIRRKRIDAPFRDRAELAAMDIVFDPDSDANAWTRTLHLSDRFQLTAYDAAYLELAQRRGVPLASLDRPLCRAAAAVGLVVLRSRRR